MVSLVYFRLNCSGLKQLADIVADHSIPSELKLSYPGGKVRASCGNALGYANPSFLGDALRAPAWWNTTDIMSLLNQISAEKVSYLSVKSKRFTNHLTIPLFVVQEADFHSETDQEQPAAPDSTYGRRGVGA